MNAGSWQNWAGNQHAFPSDRAEPTSVDELRVVLAGAGGGSVRPERVA